MRYHRKTAPRVVDGKVKRKNRWRREPDYTATHQVRIERYKPVAGYRHFISPTDVTAFLGILPDWRELAIGLQRVVLSADPSCLGWHRPGTVAVCAWDEGCTVVVNPGFYAEHAGIYRKLHVPCRRVVLVKSCPGCDFLADNPPEEDAEPLCVSCGPDLYPLDREDLEVQYDYLAYYDLKQNLPREALPRPFGYFLEFNPSTVQAFLLIHVLVHELGHHHDRMTSPRRRDATRGEHYAEEYARQYEDQILRAYRRVFRLP
jgi:hypothetical protein